MKKQREVKREVKREAQSQVKSQVKSELSRVGIGQALVEFAIAGTLIFTLLAASIDLGMIFFIKQGMDNAVQEGALYGSTNYLNFFDNEDDYDSFEEQMAAFRQSVRTRTSYESGERGGIGFINLRDLDANGIRDDSKPCTVDDEPDFENCQGGVSDSRDWEELIFVDIVKKQSCENSTTAQCSCADDSDNDGKIDGLKSGCYVKVHIESKYNILFPLAPAFKEYVWIGADYVIPFNESGYDQFGEFFTTPVVTPIEPKEVVAGPNTLTSEDFNGVEKIRITEVPAGTLMFNGSPVTLYQEIDQAGLDAGQLVYTPPEGGNFGGNNILAWKGLKDGEWSVSGMLKFEIGLNETATPTPTPTATAMPVYACTEYFSGDPDVEGGWSEMEVSEDEVVGVGQVSDTSGPLKMCASGQEIGSFSDKFYYVYQQKNGDEARNIDFAAKVSDLQSPEMGATSNTMVGLMIRDNNLETSPFAMIGYSLGSSEVFFMYRKGDEAVIADTRNLESADPWLRIVRTNDQISVSYAITSNPQEGDWIDLIDSKANPQTKWLQSLNLGENVLFGMAMASGYDPRPLNDAVTGYDKKFAQATFKDIAFGEIDEVDIRFIEPSEDLRLITGRDQTFFEVSVDLSETVYDTDDIARTTYRIYNPESEEPIDEWSQNSFMSCPFGESGGACETMDTNLYDKLTMIGDGTTIMRGADQRYRIEVEILVDGLPYTAERTFIFDPIRIAFVNPSTDITIQDINDTQFEVLAYDPKYGGSEENLAQGIQQIRYRVYNPDTSSTDIDRSCADAAEDNACTEILCAYDGTPGTCNPMSQNDFEALRAGRSYGIIARAQSLGGDWSDWTSPRINIEIPKTELRFVRPTQDDTIEGLAETPFEAEAYVPHLSERDSFDTGNGDGVQQVQFLIKKEDSGTAIYSTSDTEAPFCVFGDSGGSCSEMPTEEDGIFPGYYHLESGSYIIRARVLQKGANIDELTESDWVDQRFIVPDLPVCMDFVDQNGSVLPDDLGYITNREEKTNIRLIAYLEEGGGEDRCAPLKSNRDGEGVAEVKFTLISPIDGVDDDESTDNGEPYCLFGGSCSAMQLNQFNTLEPSINPYIIEAQVKLTESDRWSNPVRRIFYIPPMAMRFFDPDDDNPREVDGEDEVYIGDSKEVTLIEHTRFEIQAFDPRAIEVADYDPDDADEYFEEHNGVGVSEIEFWVYHEGDLVKELSYDTIGEHLCVFDEVSGDCNEMDQEDYDDLKTGDYEIVARASNQVDNYWVEERAEFIIPDIYAEFLDPGDEDEEDVFDEDSDIETVDDLPYIFNAYDWHIAMQEFPEERPGKGIDRVQFKLIDPDGDSIDAFERTVLQDDAGDYFCIFDGETIDDEECPRMDLEDFQALESGEYTLEAEVETDAGEFIEHEVTFTIPRIEMTAAFVYPHAATSAITTVTTQPISISVRSETAMQLRVAIGDYTLDELETYDGDDVQGVEFEFPNSVIDPHPDSPSNNQDLDQPYCAFGGTTICQPMDIGAYNDLDRYSDIASYTTYTIRARAQTDEDGDYGGRWTDWEEVTFFIDDGQ